MLHTVESAHIKISTKIAKIRSALDALNDAAEILHVGDANTNLKVNLMIDSLEGLETNYSMVIAPILDNYYRNPAEEQQRTKEYYRCVISENFLADLAQMINKMRAIVGALTMGGREAASKLDEVLSYCDQAAAIEIVTALERQNYEICKCGARMNIVAELSELHCLQCGKIRKIIGAVFRNEQFYPQEGQKTKHGSYDASRHYRFWIERLQAIENKKFETSELDAIEFAVAIHHNRKHLTCENIREILKDSAIKLTYLNDHTPLLLKQMGGPVPPLMNFYENRLLAMFFNMAMELYELINPDGGNKPYYPYFIYKLIERLFRGRSELLRLLDYIHLQSRETVIKNDLHWKDMCELARELYPEHVDIFTYSPTDPAGRL